MRKPLAWFALLMMVGLAAQLQASREEAQAAYRLGINSEKMGNDRRATAEYTAAILADLSFAPAYKQMGNCYFRLGDKRKALNYYDAYLRLVPGDQGVQRYAAWIRLKLGLSTPTPVPTPTPTPTSTPTPVPTPAQTGEAPQEEYDLSAVVPAPAGTASEAAPERAGLALRGLESYVGVAVQGLMPSGGDLKQIYANAESSTVSGYGIIGEVHVGVSQRRGFGAEAGIEELFRNATVAWKPSGGSAATDSYAIQETGIFVAPMYRLGLSGPWTLIAGLKAGYAWDLMTMDYSSMQLHAEGVYAAPTLRLEWDLGGGIAVDLGAEYRVSGSAAARDLSGNTARVTDAQGLEHDWHIDHAGLSVRLGMDFYFGK